MIRWRVLAMMRTRRIRRTTGRQKGAHAPAAMKHLAGCCSIVCMHLTRTPPQPIVLGNFSSETFGAFCRFLLYLLDSVHRA